LFAMALSAALSRRSSRSDPAAGLYVSVPYRTVSIDAPVTSPSRWARGTISAALVKDEGLGAARIGGWILAALCPQLNIGPFAVPLTIERWDDASLRKERRVNPLGEGGFRSNHSHAHVKRCPHPIRPQSSDNWPFVLSNLQAECPGGGGPSILRAQESPVGGERVRFAFRRCRPRESRGV